MILLSVFLLIYGARLGMASRTCDGRSAAETALEYYSMVPDCWNTLISFEGSTNFSTSTLLNMTKPGQKPQCLALLHATDGEINVHQLLGNAPVCQRSLARVHATRIVLQSLWSSMAASTRSLWFWVDYTDGTVMSNEMFEYLHYPVLTYGKGHQDDCSMPIPQLYHLLAMIGSNETLLAQYAEAVSVHEVGFAKKITAVLQEEYPTVPWEQKASKAVYRGSCFPTANPDAGDPNTYMFLRGAVCEAATHDPEQASVFDVGGTNVGYCGSMGKHGNFFKTLCHHCTPCNTSKPLARDAMVDYKYQINVDGYGPTFDAIFWKLRSSSVVMHVVRELRDGQVDFFYDTWYSGLLEPWQHYIPVTTSSLVSAVQDCLENDAACKQIGQNGNKLVKCELGQPTQKMYLQDVLMMIEQVQHPDDTAQA